MSCDLLPGSGHASTLGLVLLVVSILAGAGVVSLLLARHRRKAASAVLAVLLILGTTTFLIGMTSSAPDDAANPGCSSSDRGLTVVQTSTMEGLAPGVAAVPIRGRLVNRGQDDTYVASVDVEISSIDRAPGSPEGACRPSDYELGDPRMLVGRGLPPGGSTAFGGATLGFATKLTNQDACQGVTVHLRYTANPG